MDKTIWNVETYEQFIKELETYSDNKYKNFHFKLLNSDVNLLGVRTPILKKMAKNISVTNYHDWLIYNKHVYYEEIVIHGLIVTYAKSGWDDFIEEFDHFTNYIDNWAACDIVCANAKNFKKNLKRGLEYINLCLNNENVWKKRVGLVLLLDFYINDEYINIVLDLANHQYAEEYYVKMAQAWLISICYIKYPKNTEKFLCNTRIDKWTLNKAISKICDSKRITKENKLRLKKELKRQ